LGGGRGRLGSRCGPPMRFRIVRVTREEWGMLLEFGDQRRRYVVARDCQFMYNSALDAEPINATSGHSLNAVLTYRRVQLIP